jgi:hypothetical protein
MFFLKKILSKKYFVPALALILIVSIFIPLSSCFAGAELGILGNLLWGTVSQAVEQSGQGLASAILGVFFGLLQSIPLFVLGVALDILNWVASGDFLQVSMTNSGLAIGKTGYNPVVGAGWDFVRNLANVVLIFGLVIIALSIILGYQETRAKKALVNFILIAALINFTPVICGLVIDLSTIIMDLLLKGGVPPTISTLLAQKASAGGGIADIPTLFVVAIFCFFASIIYLLFALLFLVRVVYLWILVILSPIAFATKVLPENKYIFKIFPRVCTWDGWWDDFLQWTFIGIPAAGAIYLSNAAMYKIAENPNVIASAPSGSALSGTLALLFSYSIPFVILIVGFFTSLDAGGVAGSKIKGLANKAWGATGGRVTGAVSGVASGAALGGALGFASGAMAGSQSGARLGTLRGAFKGAGQGALTGGEREKQQINRWYTRNVKERLGLAPTGSATQDEQKEINNLASSYKNIEVAELQRIAQQNPTTVKNRREKMAAIAAAVDRGEDDIIRNAEINWITANQPELRRRGADLNKIADYAPELAPRINGQTIQQTVQGMSAKKFQETVRAQSLNSFDILTHANERQIRKMLEDGSPSQVNNLRRLGGTQNQANINAHYNALLTRMRATPTQQERDAYQRQINNFLDNVIYIQSNP